MKKKKKLIFHTRFKVIVTAFLIILLIIGAFSCSRLNDNSDSGNKTPDTQSSADSGGDSLKNDDNTDQSDGTDTPDNTTKNDSEPESSIEGAVPGSKKGTVRTGAENYGFVDVPNTWVTFTDQETASLSGLSVKQYSDAAGKNIITLNCSESQTEPKSAASSCWTQMEQEGASDIHGATVTLDGYESYQVYGYYADEDIVLVIWIFSDGTMLHYVSAEGPADSVSDTVKMIENTFSLKKAA